jgi:uncharacterized protein (TIGR02145 family)
MWIEPLNNRTRSLKLITTKLKKMDNQKIKIVDNFIWLLITDKAKEVYQSGAFEGSIYALYDDDVETEFIDTYEELIDALERGLEIGIDLGRPRNITAKWDLYNSDVTTFRNLDPIMEAKTDEEWIKAGQQGIPAWCYYENNPKWNSHCGKLYNWYAVNDKRGLAPEGFKIPTREQLNSLKVHPGYLKLGGWRNHAQTIHGNYLTRFEGIKKNGFFWSSSEDRVINYNDGNGESAWYKYFVGFTSAFTNDYDSGIDVCYKSLGASVIFVKD